MVMKFCGNADVRLRFLSWCLVKILKIGLVKSFKFKFRQNADAWLILKLVLGRDFEDV